MLRGWDQYPIALFPGLWSWLGKRVASKSIRLPKVAFGEVGHKAQDCCEWLEANDHKVIVATPQIYDTALRIATALQIENDAFDPEGVDHNDLLIIATACVQKDTLVTDESLQFKLPKNLKKYKIPAVCDLPTVRVNCVSFLKYISQAKSAF
ncbi:DUF4411 domain-containing protein [Ahniella affigens]|uniref:DUF4411 domain-containing protein n=2 Tax=Ahniella affigens TaxID=2021234 RepID=A0A2P1PNM2_9GAMM|nr:DUF4411 domain-containing protein [Ahniella affigens]